MIWENEQTAQADWAANSQESNVDYTPTPPSAGDVILQGGAGLLSFENINSEFGGGDGADVVQGFKVSQNVRVNTISIYSYAASVSVGCHIAIYTGMSASGPTGLVATSNTIDVPAALQWTDFSITAELTGGTQYYFFFSNGGNRAFKSNNTNAYADGTAWYYDSAAPPEAFVEDTNQDIVFRIYYFDYYDPSGYIRTQTMDLGSTPTVDGQWTLSDTRPSGTSITYQAWASATGAFAGEETDLGTITDGAAITNRKRYYRVKATLNANTALELTPSLLSIKARFITIDLAGAISGGSAVVAAMTGRFNLSGIITSISSATATMTGRLNLSGVINGISSLAGYLSFLSGVITATSNIFAKLSINKSGLPIGIPSKNPSLIIELEAASIENEQTAQADWAANSQESNVDYTPTPPSAGDVILQGGAGLLSFENINSEFGGGAGADVVQGFKVSQNVRVNTISIYSYAASVSVGCHIAIYTGMSASGPTGLVATSNTIDVPAALQWTDFIIDADLTGGTQYYFFFGNGGNRAFKSNNTNAYADGTAWYYDSAAPPEAFVEDTNQDIVFRIFYFDYYFASGYIRTQTMDLGATPTVDGEWILSDIKPSGTSITYQAWASATGAFAGEETDLGTITDGAAITNRKRYYRVKATLNADTNLTATPTLLSIKARFVEFVAMYTNNEYLPYEFGVKNISSLSTVIDAFKSSTISALSLTMALSKSLSNYIATRYPKNKTVNALIGWKTPGGTRADHTPYMIGQIKDIDINANDEVIITTYDFKTEWEQKIPAKWQSTADDVVWTNQHPIDVMLDILQNKINIRDSKIEIASFNTIKTALTGWKVSRTITKNPVSAKELLDELRLITSSFFLPLSNGRIKIKRWDANETAVDTLTDADVLHPGFSWKGNYDSLINSSNIYYNWDGDGDNAADYTALDIAIDSTSQTNWGEKALKEIKDKWTLSADGSQINTLRSNILARFSDPVAIMTCAVDRNRIYLETGSIINVTTKRYPSSDYNGVVNKPFQIIKRNLDFMNSKIDLTILEV